MTADLENSNFFLDHSSMTLIRLAAGFLLSLASAMPVHALVAGDPSGVPIDSPMRRIDANTPRSPWAGVGSISVNGGTYSGVVIGPHQILTAAHVVAGSAASNINFNLNIDGDLSQSFAAKSITINPGYGKQAFRGIALNDLAVIHLASDLPPNVPRYPLLMEPLPIGAVIALVGYGASGDGLRGITVAGQPNIKRVGSNALDMFVPPPKRFEMPQAYLFDFDGPNVSNSLGGLSLGNALETTLGSGDSGSPAFANIDGQWMVAGINTFQLSQSQRPAAPLFGSMGGGMFVPAYATWIRTTLSPSVTTSMHDVWLFGFVGVVGLVWARRSRWRL